MTRCLSFPHFVTPSILSAHSNVISGLSLILFVGLLHVSFLSSDTALAGSTDDPLSRLLASSELTLPADPSTVTVRDNQDAAMRNTNLPDPAMCAVLPPDDLGGFVLAPSSPEAIPASVVTVTIRNNAGSPIGLASVVIQFNDPGAPTCHSTVLHGVTDASGEVTFNVGGGGCVIDTEWAGAVKANGITIRIFEDLKSPDGDADLTVSLADLVSFTSEFLDGTGGCHDYNNDGTTALSDLTIFGPAFTSGVNCAP